LINRNGTAGLLLTIGGTTFAKCLPSLEQPAPTQTVTISSNAKAYQVRQVLDAIAKLKAEENEESDDDA